MTLSNTAMCMILATSNTKRKNVYPTGSLSRRLRFGFA